MLRKVVLARSLTIAQMLLRADEVIL